MIRPQGTYSELAQMVNVEERKEKQTNKQGHSEQRSSKACSGPSNWSPTFKALRFEDNHKSSDRLITAIILLDIG